MAAKNGEAKPKTVKRKGEVNDQGFVEWTEEKVDRALNVFAAMREDGWVNVLTSLGIAGRDKREGATLTRSSRLTQQREWLEELFHADDLAARYVELPAQEMTREWFDLVIDGDAEAASLVMQTLDTLNAQNEITTALVWARLYGGSIVLLGVDDGQDMKEPLNLDAVKSISFLTAMDRHDIDVATIYSDPREDKFGKPETYRISASDVERAGNVGEIVHESRVLRFDGAMTSRRRRKENSGWAESVLTRNWRVIRDYQQTLDGVAHLLQDFSQATFKIKGLAKMLAADKDALVLQRLRMLDVARSIVRAVPLDEGEEFERKGSPVAGMSDLVDRQMMRVSAATGIPVTLLFGRSPAGLNATGDADIRLFYDSVAGRQESELRHPIEYLLLVTMRAKDGPTRGQEPDSWGFAFNPLYQESAKEKAETRKLVAEADAIYLDRGVVLNSEVSESRFGGDTYSPETMLDDTARAEIDEEKARLVEAQRQAARALPVIGDEREDARDDAPHYRAQADVDKRNQICSLCGFNDAGFCLRWDFTWDAGHTCDDWVEPSALIEHADARYRGSRKRSRRRAPGVFKRRRAKR